MNFAEQLPSKQWAALTFRGAQFAEVWFKPKGEPLALLFRIPQHSFEIPGIGQRLTTENLLKTVGIAPEEVDSWRQGGTSNSALDGRDPQLSTPLPQPPQGVPQLEIYVRLKPPLQVVARKESGEPEVASVTWQELEARWKGILGLEAAIDTLRISMEGLRTQMEASLNRTLTPDEKLHALAADVAQWHKAKSRLHYVLPKAREFIHRANWALSTPERKRLGELFKNLTEGHMPLPQMAEVLEELDALRKERQVLSAQGVAVNQECKCIGDAVHGALRSLQSNAAAKALKKKGEAGARRKPF
jgi:hypothetical protein